MAKQYILKCSSETFTGSLEDCYDRAAIIIHNGGAVSIKPCNNRVQIGATDC